MKEISSEEKRLLINLANRIKSLRIEKGYSNYEHFANDSGISRTQYGRYEQGDNLKFLTLCKVLDGLGITLKEFFSEGFDH
ncbi:helix-turn-helix domain-containing protein [Pedobacter rhizosphaerae]|uniref:Helix-turn-helix n=1 Tax=Pedobacter rhizosphaerae TaxID=390241 RepID=A0A1H9T3E9_9SPHI|nr:helix-turn-helix transcriptional regulator [Pedobacter rhizosphaerae]SER91143.1 Helix-turn-helix [Pedobacter rhizosphaerae]